MKNITFLLVCFVLFYSCQKDVGSKEDIDVRSFQSKSINLASHNMQDNYKWKSPFIPKTPPLSLLESIDQEMKSYPNWDEFSNGLVVYGKIRWNWSIIEATSHDRYVVFLPVYDESELTAIIMYQNDSDHNHFTFKSIKKLELETDNYNSLDVPVTTSIFVAKYFLYTKMQYSIIDKRVNKWLRSWMKENINLFIEKRDVDISVSYTYWEATGRDIDLEGEFQSSVLSGSGQLVAGTANLTILCTEGIGGEGDDPVLPPIILIDPDPTDPGGSTNDPLDPDPDPDYNPTINIDDEECKVNYLTSEVIAAIENSTIVFPCNESVPDDIYNDILATLCDSMDINFPDMDGGTDDQGGLGSEAFGENISIDDLEGALDGYDYIIEEESFIECENYKCVFDYLMNNSTGRYCSDMDQIFDSEDYDIVYQTHNSGADGEATYRSIENGSINISLHIADCENTDLLFNAETLYHEGTHALFYQELLIDGLETNSTEAIQEAWAIYASENFDIPYQSQHIAMVYEYMDKAAEFLWELNGMQLSKDHYMKYVYDGLKEWFEFPPNDIENWNEKWNELNGNDPYITNYNTFSCN